MTEIKKHRRLPHNKRKHLAYRRMYRAMRYGDRMPNMHCESLNAAHKRIVKHAESDRKQRKDLEDFTNGT